MPLDLSLDYQVIDGTETVSYFVWQGEGNGYAASVSVNNIERRQISKEDLIKDASLLTQQTLVFHLWTSQLGGIVPKRTDEIVDTNSVVWIVWSVRVLDVSGGSPQRYRCVCKIQQNATVPTPKSIPTQSFWWFHGWFS